MYIRDQTKQKSAVAVLIDKATVAAVQQEANWSLFVHICDLINRTSDYGAKDAAKAIRKRLGCKVQEDIYLTLKLLETCMKNCGKSFHACVGTSKFLQDLIKVINPKYHPSIEMQNNVLGLIQAWANSFRSVPELKEFNKIYQDLKLKGVEFPPLDQDMLVLPRQPPAKQMRPYPPPAAPTLDHSNQLVAELGKKFTGDLLTVRNNCKVFNEMLNEIKPGRAHEIASDLELLEDLNKTCLQMQRRITELIETAQFEKHMEELLMVNDDLNNVFLRYDRFKRLLLRRPAEDSETTLQQPFYLEPSRRPEPPPNSDAMQMSTNIVGDKSTTYDSIYDTLVDLSIDQPAETQVQQPQIPPRTELAVYDNVVPADSRFSTNFDPFATQTQLPWQRPNLMEPLVSSTNQLPPSIDEESDYEEMARWLKENPRQATAEEPVGAAYSNDEFDRFLASRAQEIQQLPNVTEHAKSGSLNNDNQSELLLF